MPKNIAAASLPSDEEIRKMLVDRIDGWHQSVGIVVGVLEPEGRRIVSYGKLDTANDALPDGDTVFEMGSVTKVFTSLLLTSMVQSGEVALTDPVAKYLPPGVKVPERNGRSITLEDLATHTSGLPRLPTNLSPANPADPYADYSADRLYQFLSSCTLPRDIGSTYEYSNLGGGLLGHALARRSGKSYEALLQARILEPLHMTSSGITLSPQMKGHMAIGHNEKLEAVPNWHLDVLAGAGALRSSVEDMLRFLSAELGYSKTALAPAMASMLTVRRPTGNKGLDIALGWHILTPAGEGSEIVWHNGGTGGFRSFVGFDARKRIGVVVLSNTFTAAGVDDIGFHLLDSNLPLVSAPKARAEIKLDPKRFDCYTGSYQMTPNLVLRVTRDGGRFFVQMTGQPKFEIFAETEHDYFLKVVDAQLTFETDNSGHSTAVVLHQMGRDLKGLRIP